MYSNGVGIPLDMDKAYQCYEAAAKLGDAAAQYNLGVLYSSAQGPERSDEKALHWYRKAAEQGDAAAQFNLGLMYATGQGVEQNDASALEWYQLAADQGDAQAQYNLGVMIAIGQGTQPSRTVAMQWLQLAADQGDVLAWYNLGALTRKAPTRRPITSGHCIATARRHRADNLTPKPLWDGCMPMAWAYCKTLCARTCGLTSARSAAIRKRPADANLWRSK
ncbi:MAG: sel1 repeat family protein [Betaproteobacteria bacterium]|nr:sel1 repeat family protein [Betaproteobacteria bacterium]